MTTDRPTFFRSVIQNPCPFTKRAIYCGEADCGKCPIRKEFGRQENDRIAENTKDLEEEVFKRLRIGKESDIAIIRDAIKLKPTGDLEDILHRMKEAGR